MGTYVLRRLLQMIPVFFGATFLIFYLVLGMPGDPLASMCGERGCDPATAAALRAQFHIGQPLHIQYFEYMKGILTLDFGETSRNFWNEVLITTISSCVTAQSEGGNRDAATISRCKSITDPETLPVKM